MRMLALLLVVGMLGVGRAHEPVAPKPEISAGQEVPKKADAPQKEREFDVPPEVIVQVEPEYSEKARKAGISGTVLVRLTVGLDGVPANVHVLEGTGYGLDEEAVKAVRQYRFKPAMKNGKAIEIELNIEVSFHIKRKPY